MLKLTNNLSIPHNNSGIKNAAIKINGRTETIFTGNQSKLAVIKPSVAHDILHDTFLDQSDSIMIVDGLTQTISTEDQSRLTVTKPLVANDILDVTLIPNKGVLYLEDILATNDTNSVSVTIDIDEAESEPQAITQRSASIMIDSGKEIRQYGINTKNVFNADNVTVHKVNILI